MIYRITVLPENRMIDAEDGEKLLSCLRRSGLAPDAPCGGVGRCGKCKVMVNGREVLACKTVIDREMIVTLPTAEDKILLDGITVRDGNTPIRAGNLLAIDIGTTTVAAFLLDGKTGEELAAESVRNPQTAFGADVISRIRHALSGQFELLTGSIRRCVKELTLRLCKNADVQPGEIRVVSIVGNPAMQQFFLGILPDNLAKIPFSPVLKQADTIEAEQYLSICENAMMLIVPDISGFVGADTLAGVLATGLDSYENYTLLVDIGTNGEMVLGNRHRMAACSTAAGPALEGANIRFGMRGQTGAIDHVWMENGEFQCSVIGGGAAEGICGSGLIDAVAMALDAGMINSRGRIQNENRVISLTDEVHLTQDDIRQVQMAKGAIAAGIELMADNLGIALQEIDKVYLAGAFGTCMNPNTACRIGLLPAELAGRVEAVGNAAGSGAKMLACSEQELEHVQQLVSKIEFMELASVPGFQRSFARNMRF